MIMLMPFGMMAVVHQIYQQSAVPPVELIARVNVTELLFSIVLANVEVKLC